MAWQVYWVIEDHVLYANQFGGVTLDDIRGISHDIADYVEAAHQRSPENITIGIVDMREARIELVVRALASSQIYKIFDVVDRRVWKFKPGFTVLIASNNYVSALVSTIIRISNQPMTTVATMEEALTVIKHMYPELTELLDSYAHKD